MRAGTDTALARVVKVFGAARPHHAYLFANKSATRMKVLVYDGFGIWLAALAPYAPPPEDGWQYGRGEAIAAG